MELTETTRALAARAFVFAVIERNPNGVFEAATALRALRIRDALSAVAS